MTRFLIGDASEGWPRSPCWTVQAKAIINKAKIFLFARGIRLLAFVH
jgi:hypothetical protein